MIKPLPMQLQCLCYITVDKLFASYRKYLSMGIKWSNFPLLAESDCKRQVYLNTSFEISQKTQNRQQKQAEKLGYDFAHILMKEAGMNYDDF